MAPPEQDEPAPLRFANVLVLALVARLIPAQAVFLAGRVARPFIMCGRHSLHVFCLGILLATTIGRLVINEFLGGVLLQCVVSAAGIAIMIGTAAVMDWFNAGQRPSGPRVLRASATDGGV